jgi:hypothetical protein
VTTIALAITQRLRHFPLDWVPLIVGFGISSFVCFFSAWFLNRKSAGMTASSAPLIQKAPEPLLSEADLGIYQAICDELAPVLAVRWAVKMLLRYPGTHEDQLYAWLEGTMGFGNARDIIDCLFLKGFAKKRADKHIYPSDRILRVADKLSENILSAEVLGNFFWQRMNASTSR